MKTRLLTAATLLAFASAVLAQGSFYLNADSDNNGVTINTAGNWYNGTYGVEVWELNGTPNTVLMNAINATDNSGSYYWCPGRAAYNLMVADGFKLEATFANLTMSDGSPEVPGVVNMPDVSPAGSTVTVALAMWNNSATSWQNMLSYGNQTTTRAGVTAFSQATAILPANAVPITTWNSYDLVMTIVIPEPSTLALIGVGAAALVIFRPRR